MRVRVKGVPLPFGPKYRAVGEELDIDEPALGVLLKIGRVEQVVQVAEVAAKPAKKKSKKKTTYKTRVMTAD